MRGGNNKIANPSSWYAVLWLATLCLDVHPRWRDHDCDREKCGEAFRGFEQRSDALGVFGEVSGLLVSWCFIFTSCRSALDTHNVSSKIAYVQHQTDPRIRVDVAKFGRLWLAVDEDRVVFSL
jgi:hypothetical protein